MLIRSSVLDFILLSYNKVLLFSHLGHFALTNKLLPLLKATADLPGSDVRIVTVCLLKIELLIMGLLTIFTR